MNTERDDPMRALLEAAREVDRWYYERDVLWVYSSGPVLAAILTLAATQSTTTGAVGLLGAYSLGLAIPFLFATVALDRFILTSKKFKVMMPWVNRVSGAMLILIGLLLISGAMTRMAQWFAQFMPANIG